MCGLVTLGKKAGKNFYVTYLNESNTPFGIPLLLLF